MLSSPPATPPAQTVPQQRAVVADAPEGKAFRYPHLVPTRAPCQSWKRGTENGEGAPAERGCRPVRRCCDSWTLEGSRQQENKNTSYFRWDCQAQGYCEPWTACDKTAWGLLSKHVHVGKEINSVRKLTMRIHLSSFHPVPPIMPLPGAIIYIYIYLFIYLFILFFGSGGSWLLCVGFL